jgi:small conductance mechanosensitive channel
MEAWIDRGRELLVTYGPGMLAGLLILLVGYLLARQIAKLTTRVLRRVGIDEILVPFLSRLTFLLIMALVLLAGLDKLGIDTTSFAAALAAAGLAIGLALQGSLGNVAAGVLLIVFRPFRVGDYVETAGVGGTVDKVSVFATELITPDHRKIIVPNSSITGGNIVNYTALDRRRIDLVIGIGYGDDLAAAKELLRELLTGHPKVLAEPAPQIAVSELGESSVNFAVRPWVRTTDYWDVRFELTEQIKQAFDARGISIPFPQRDVHLYPAGPVPALEGGRPSTSDGQDQQAK